MGKPKRTNKYLLLAALIVAIAVPTVRQLLKAQTFIDSLNSGVILEATPRQQGRLFEGTKVLIVEYSDKGTTGVVINETLASVLARYPDAFDSDIEAPLSNGLHWGGPVQIESTFSIFYDLAKPYFKLSTVPLEKLDSIDTATYRGYTGWSAGQLESEIRRGDWRVNLVSKKDLANLLKGSTKNTGS